jgi:glycosyltransferase involved in cell wall biosynthesis
MLVKHLKTFLLKKPIIKDNTFLIWEPCSSSHAEVVPGYAKYLLDLGYHVSVLMTPKRYQEGLFCRFDSSANISYNSMTQRQIRRFFKHSAIKSVQGVLVTTVGKLYDGVDFSKVYSHFHSDTDKAKLFFVEHEIDKPVDNNALSESVITLRKMPYKQAKTTVVNPHYFGNISVSPKGETTNFITIGALSEKRKSTRVIVDAVKALVDRGVRDFKVTVVGKGSLSNLPGYIRPYFAIKGRLNFDEMYHELEKADFMLTAFENTEAHLKYAQSKTSGAYQLVYAFLKPVVIKHNQAEVNGFDAESAIVYTTESAYPNAMLEAIKMSSKTYVAMQSKLKSYVDSLHLESKNNLKSLITKSSQP